MALKNAYCSVADLRAEIQNNSADASELEGHINFASRWVDEYTGRTFYEKDFTSTALVLKPRDPRVLGDRIFLDTDKILSVTELKYAGDVLVENTDFVVNYAEGIIEKVSGEWKLWHTDGYIELKAKLGWDQGGVETAVPADLPAKISLSTIFVAAAISGMNQKEVGSLEGGTISITDRDIPREVFKMLGQRRGIQC